MRLSTVLQVSFVGALMFTPAMAEDIQQVHEQALKILRAQEAAPADASSGSSVREQRETLRRQQAAQAEMRRQQQQEERRRQFEAEQQRRQAVRQQVLQSAPANSNPGSMSPDEMHEKALAILRNTQPGGAVSAPASGELAPSQLPQQSAPQASTTVVAPAPTVVAAAPDSTPSPEVQERAREILKQQQAEMQKAQPAPATVSAPASTLSGNTPEQEALHERALEILRQQTATSQATSQPVQPAPAPAPAVSPAPAAAPAAPVASTPALTAPSVTPAPTEAVTVQTTAPAPGTSGDVDLIHEQALRVLHQDLGQPTGAAQALDAKTREIISRQNQEIARQLGTTRSSMPALNSTPTQASSMPQHELAPEMEARAREILRQQMANSGATAAATTPAPAPVTSAPVATSAANNYNTQEQVQYSRELEQKARQTILNNSQNASAAAPAPAPAPAAAPAPSVTPTPAPAPEAPTIATTPAPAAGATTSNQSDADIAAIHAKALDTMQHVLNPSPLEQSNQILSSQKNKREKLNELTDLYKADKLTPAQYHEYRARILAQPQ